MKRLLFFITAIFFTINSFGQFSDTAALNAYIRDTVKDRRPEKVTAAQIQKALLGTTQFLNIAPNFTTTNLRATGNRSHSFADGPYDLKFDSTKSFLVSGTGASSYFGKKTFNYISSNPGSTFPIYINHGLYNTAGIGDSISTYLRVESPGGWTLSQYDWYKGSKGDVRVDVGGVTISSDSTQQFPLLSKKSEISVGLHEVRINALDSLRMGGFTTAASADTVIGLTSSSPQLLGNPRVYKLTKVPTSGLINSGLNVGNGLVKSGNTIKIGGTFTDPTTWLTVGNDNTIIWEGNSNDAIMDIINYSGGGSSTGMYVFAGRTGIEVDTHEPGGIGLVTWGGASGLGLLSTNTGGGTAIEAISRGGSGNYPITSSHRSTNTGIVGALQIDRMANNGGSTLPVGTGVGLDFTMQVGNRIFSNFKRDTVARIHADWVDTTLEVNKSKLVFSVSHDSLLTDRFTILNTGQLKAHAYGIGTFKDTAAKVLSPKADGTIVEMDVSDIISQAYSTIRPAYRALNNFTDSANFNTSMGCTFSGGKIVVSSGDVLFNSWLSFKDTVCSNHWRISARCSNVSAQTTNTTYGFSVGMRSVNSSSKNSLAAFPNTSNDAFSGRFEFFVQANSGSFNPIFRMGSGSTVANTQNDKLIVSMERNNSTLTITVYNETTKAVAADTTITISLESGIAIMPNTSVPTIWFHSTAGTVQVDSLYFQDFEAKKADILFLGDSKTYGFGASSFTNTWPSILAQSYPNYAICAGFGDRTQDIRARLNQVIALKPKVVIAAFGSNDVREAVWNTIGQTNYSYIDSALMANGIYVLHCLPFKENTLDLTAQKDWIVANAQFTGRIIDTWTPTLEGGLLYSDGIHLKDRGNRRIATAIKTSPLLLNRGIRVENVNQ